MIKDISSLKNEIIKYAYKLKDASFSKKENKLIIESEHLIEMAKDELIEVFVLKPTKLDNKITQYIVSKEIMEKLSSGKSPAKVIGIINSTIKTIDRNSNILVYLDNIQDPGNVGTIIRTADAANISAVILTKGCVDLFSPKVLRSTMGSVFHMPIFEGMNINEIILQMRKSGYKIIASHLRGQINYYDEDLNGRIAIIVGNEANGISDETAELSDRLVKIPMPGRAESLNASVAASIMIYEIVRHKTKWKSCLFIRI